MNQISFKKLLPHVIAIAIFLLVAIIFCKPSLESGVILKQGDVAGWQGMSHQSFEYKEQHGHFPLWVTNMFCGMPGYQIALEGYWSPLSVIDKTIQLGLPQPINFFFLACICFYFMCICIGITPFAAIIGSIGFAYSSFSPIIITAGHNTQMLALAYAPAVIGAIVLIFNKRYWIGFALTALLTALQIGQGHQQISYYLFLVIGFMTISYLIYFIKNKQTPHFIKSIGLIAIAGVIGVAANALVLMTTYDYSKDSKRGGQLVMDGKANEKDNVKDGKTTGLTKDYAFMWSYGKVETWSLMFPGVMGYGSHQAERDGDVYVFPQINDNGHLIKYLNEELPNFPADQVASQMNGALYWGDQPFTNGPVYLGAIICFLFVLGMFILDNRHKWWILAASVFAILLSWGEHLPGFNYFMFDNFPLYNKFRVPTMTLVIPQLLFPIMAALTINKLLISNDELTWKHFQKAGIAIAVIFALAGYLYISSDFSKENKERTTAFNAIIKAKNANMNEQMNQLNEKYKAQIDNQILEGMTSNLSQDPNIDASQKARSFLNALKQDRADLFKSDIIRSLILIVLAMGLIALYLRSKISSMIMLAGVTLISCVDLLQFGMHYLNDKSFENKDAYEAGEFPKSNADNIIENDKDPNFRVMNTSSLEESKTSYYHKSIGGYHPAKIGIYDDLMAYQLNGNPNMNVINMLNTKYFIQQQGNEKVASLNPSAMGNCWLVNGVKYVNGPVAEMKALSTLNPSDTAVVDESFKSKITAFAAKDSLSFIKMTTFDNDAISYESNCSGSKMAVFSEIYYKDWKAYIDGQPADFVKANYVLRAMVVPAGKHKIDFKFEPKVFYTGRNISNIATWLMMLILLGAIFMEYKKQQAQKTV